MKAGPENQVLVLPLRQCDFEEITSTSGPPFLYYEVRGWSIPREKLHQGGPIFSQ